jgi:hypothetical protein
MVDPTDTNPAATESPTDADIESSVIAADSHIDEILTEDANPDLTCYTLWGALVEVLLQLGWTPEDLTKDLADLIAAVQEAPTETNSTEETPT